AAKKYHDLYIALANEVLHVALHQSVQPEGFNGFDPRAFLPGVARTVSIESLNKMVVFNQGSAKTHSGIWRDLAVRKRRTEVDAQLGHIVKIASELGLETPLLQKL